MDKLKHIVKGKMAEDPYDVICWGKPTSETFQKAVQKYKCSSNEEKEKYLCRIYGKLKKKKNFSISLAMVHFLGEILDDEVKLDLPKALPEVNYTECKSSKEEDLLRRYFDFYYYYVRKYIFRPRLTQNIHDLALDLVVKYFEDSEDNILKIIQEKKTLEECIKTGTNEQIINITLTWILKNANQDLIRLHKFFRRHWKLIANNELVSERLIVCYAKSVQIESQIGKLEKLSALINFEFQDNPHVLDAKLQQVIQKDISIARNQKKNNVKNQQWKSCTTEQVRQHYDEYF